MGIDNDCLRLSSEAEESGRCREALAMLQLENVVLEGYALLPPFLPCLTVR